MLLPLNFDINGILACQRNRHPLLFVDQIYNVIPGEKASGVKCFSYNEWFFPAHFDDEPNVPGFIQVESLVQTFIMTFLSKDELKGKKTNFLEINNVKFKRKIIPGETLTIHATLSSFRRGIATGGAVSFVGDSQACSADFIVAVPDVLDQFKPRNTL
jgi:3-hydroxyacyl-[acyl-carrier-protein] dehydratase